jgi:hypothetical protein
MLQGFSADSVRVIQPPARSALIAESAAVHRIVVPNSVCQNVRPMPRSLRGIAALACCFSSFFVEGTQDG